jgi:membrane protein implicated in regulation of membrane protease activity
MIESILAALAFGTFWFWAILIVASVIITACVENEHYSTPTVVAIILAAIYWKAITALPWSIIGIAIGSFVLIGACWSIFQWFRRVQKKATEFKEEFGATLTTQQMRDLQRLVSASDNKALITGWIAFWPWDMFWTFTGDFFNMIYDALSSVYTKISTSATGKFAVKDPEPAKEVITDALPRRHSRY